MIEVEFFRLFTDGGRKSPHSRRGEAGCGYVIVEGPFKNYGKGMITDKDGTVVAEGRAYLGNGEVTVNMAEYVGLMLGLRRCLEMGQDCVHMHTFPPNDLDFHRRA